MTLLRTLRAYKGGLLRIKGQLYWYAGRGWDGVPGRICLVLDAAPRPPAPAAGCTIGARATLGASATRAVLLLIDGCPYWVWVAREDVEIL